MKRFAALAAVLALAAAPSPRALAGTPLGGRDGEIPHKRNKPNFLIHRLHRYTQINCRLTVKICVNLCNPWMQCR